MAASYPPRRPNGTGPKGPPGWDVVLTDFRAVAAEMTQAANSIRAAGDQNSLGGSANDRINMGDLTAAIIRGVTFVNNSGGPPGLGGGTIGTNGTGNGHNRPTTGGNQQRRPNGPPQPGPGPAPKNRGVNPNNNPAPPTPNPRPRPPAPPTPTTVAQGRAIGQPNVGPYSHGYPGYSSFRGQVANALHNRLGSGSGSSFQPHYDKATGAHVGYMEIDQQGREVGMHDLTNPNTAGLVSAAARRGQISGMASGFSTGGLMGAARAAGPVGAAVTAGYMAYQGAQFVTEQRAKNAQYQAIYGGSNYEGMKQRISGKGFELGQLFTGGMTQDMSQQAFQGVSSLGMKGDQRSNALDMISTSYKKMGMGVQESLDLVALSARTFNKDLSGLQASLESVTKTAKDTGQSAVELRAAFTENYKSFSKNNSSGGAVRGMADAVTNFTGGLGQTARQYSDTSQMFNPEQMRRMAYASGMNYSEFIGKSSGDSSLAIAGAGKLLESAAKATFSGQQMKRIAEMTKGKTPDQGLYQSIAQTLLSEDQGSLADIAIANLASYAQINTSDPMTAVMWLVKAVVEGTISSAGVKQENQRTRESSMDPDTKMRYDAAKTTAAGGDPTGGNHVPTAKQISDAKAEVISLEQNSPDKITDPVLEMAGKKLGDKKVVVDSKQGKIVVNMGTAIAKFPDQIATGTAILVDTGQSVKTALNGASEDNYYDLGGADTKSADSGANIVTGNSHGVINKNNAVELNDFVTRTGISDPTQMGGGNGGGANVTITASAELQRYLSINVDPVGGAAANGTPTSPNVIPGTRGAS